MITDGLTSKYSDYNNDNYRFVSKFRNPELSIFQRNEINSKVRSNILKDAISGSDRFIYYTFVRNFFRDNPSIKAIADRNFINKLNENQLVSLKSAKYKKILYTFNDSMIDKLISGQQECIDIFHKHESFILNSIIKHLKDSSSESKYRLKQSLNHDEINDKVQIYLELFNKYVWTKSSYKRSIYNYKLNECKEYTKESDVIKDWLAGFYCNIHPTLFLQMIKIYKTQYCDSIIPFSQLIEESVDISYDEIQDIIITETKQSVDTNPQADSNNDEMYGSYIEGLTASNFQDIIKKFEKTLKTIDLKIFNYYLMNKSTVDIAKELSLQQSNVSKALLDIKFRFLIFIYVTSKKKYSEISFDKAKFFQIFNSEKFNSVKQKYFNDDYHQELSELINCVVYQKKIKINKSEKTVAISETELASMVFKFDYATCESYNPYSLSGRFIWRSKRGLDGRLYKRFCTYINAYGVVYSFIGNKKCHISSLI